MGEEEPAPLRACATPGCAFQATWHATRCCWACNGDGNCRHGPKCERKPMPEKEDNPAPQPTPENEEEPAPQPMPEKEDASAPQPMPENEEEPARVRACATPGCAFQATWHATRCCAACNGDGNWRHGPKCERKPMPEK